VRKEGEALEDEGNVALVWWNSLHRVTTDDDFACVRLIEPGDHAHRGGLATAARTDDRDELAGLDRKTHIIDGHDIAEPFGRVA
jgi:hypothetical protein